MPTLYTALRARHRHTVVVPTPKLPQLRGATRPAKPLIETERLSLAARRGPTGARRDRKRPARKVVVVGAGLAGLCAAYELRGLGYNVVVFEARERVGGRVHSLDNFIAGKTVEGGAELIGSNHPLWCAYKAHFRLTFTAVEDYGNSPIRMDGRTLTFEETKTLTDDVEGVLKALTELAETIVDPFEPWTNHNAERLDGVSLVDWLKNAVREVPATRRALCRRAVEEMLAADNGIDASEQSLLGVLAMIKGGGLDRYWTDTEVYRCRGGNDQLARQFATRLGRDRNGRPRVVTNAPVTAISWSPGSATVTAVVAGKKGRAQETIVERADDVILAIPPSVWKTIAFPRPLSRQLTPPRMGWNVKFLMRLRTRFWEDYASSPTLTEDGPVNLTWETTEADRRGAYALVAFSGADSARRCVRWKPGQRRANYVKRMDVPYPGIGAAITRTRFMNWPQDKWTRASYYFPRVNEVTRWGPLWRQGCGDWLHFAGEHTCYAFVGYMEGALASGYRLARRLAIRDGVLTA